MNIYNLQSMFLDKVTDTYVDEFSSGAGGQCPCVLILFEDVFSPLFNYRLELFSQFLL